MHTTSKKNKIIGAFLGTIIGYYDYSLYTFSAKIITQKFFPTADLRTSLLWFYAVYAIPYLSKPIGSLLFGRIGDRYGRKVALSITIIGIVFPTILIGILPDYATIGILSTMILVLCKFTQGVFIGGEYDGAAIYVIEHLGTKRQFTASAITRSTGALGMLLSMGVIHFCSAPIFPEWGWRIPFLLSLPLALITLYYRQKFDETPAFKKKASNHKISSLGSLLKQQWKTIIMVIGLASGFGVTYQIGVIFMPQYLPMVLAETAYRMPTFFVLILICFIVFMLIAGLIADRITPMPVIKVGLCGTLLATLLFIVAIKYQIAGLALTAALMLASAVAPFNALAHGIFTKAFPVNERYRAISLGHTIGSMFMSGSANYICLSSMHFFDLFPIVYLSSFALLYYYMAKLFATCN